MDATPALADGQPIDSPIDSLIGALVAGRYRIEERIGEGQMARVYRARHLRLARSFAVKVLPPARARDPLMRLRFAQEAESASRLDHPNVVPVVDFGRIDSGELYLMMDLVGGDSLAAFIAREAPLAPDRAIALARSLARGLGHAHDRGLVHRDFKPDNVVLEAAGAGPPVPRILDFGLAIRCEPDGTGSEPRLTEQGFVVGTPIYLSPEQACGEPVDGRADLYALGVVLYEMLAGRPPFDGEALEVVRRKLVERAPPIARRGPAAHLPDELEALVQRLLEREPEDRFASAGDLVAALDAAEARLSRPRAVAPLLERAELLPPRLERACRSRWSPRIAAAATAALVAVALAAGVLSMVASGAPRATRSPEAMPAALPTTTLPLLERTRTARSAFAPALPASVPVAIASPAPPAPAAPSTAHAVPTVPPAAPAAVPAVPSTAHLAPGVPSTSHLALALPRAGALPRRGAASPSDEAELARLARDYREVGEALGRLHDTRGAAVAGPLEASYLRLSYADSLRVASLRREALAKLAGLRRAIHDAE